ncbi:unnamed protein product [Lactuca saligna]|uniref:Uncharacterized protein n=1 Tax=Lactuca saligna TaxID=75948 RepID=A0AA35Z8Q7_LACSI|nr:unnamed protein product [Lactuca saligna]
MFYKKTVEIRKSKGLGRCITPNLYLLHSLIVIPVISKHHRRHVSVKKKKKKKKKRVLFGGTTFFSFFFQRHHRCLFLSLSGVQQSSVFSIGQEDYSGRSSFIIRSFLDSSHASSSLKGSNTVQKVAKLKPKHPSNEDDWSSKW